MKQGVPSASIVHNNDRLGHLGRFLPCFLLFVFGEATTIISPSSPPINSMPVELLPRNINLMVALESTTIHINKEQLEPTTPAPPAEEQSLLSSPPTPESTTVATLMTSPEAAAAVLEHIDDPVIPLSETSFVEEFVKGIGLRDYNLEPSDAIHDMTDVELLRKASQIMVLPWVHKHPYTRRSKIAFMFLVRREVTLAPLWEKFFQGYEGLYSIYVHSDTSFEEWEETQGSVFHGRRIASKEVQWGDFSMIEAERRLLANALLDFSNERFVLLSESCIPLFNFPTIYAYLMGSKETFVEVYDDPSYVGRGRYDHRMEPYITIEKWRNGSQWFQMDRNLAMEFVSDHVFFAVYGNYCKGDCYSDEHYLPTIVYMRFGDRNANRTLTWVDWTRGGPHPTKFSKPEEVTVEFMQSWRSSSNSKCEYNGRITTMCHLFARKFLPTTLDSLPKYAPKVLSFIDQILQMPPT